MERLERGGAAAVGGGSDLLGMIKDDLASPDVLVNLRALPASDGLAAIVSGPAELRVGGLVTLTRLGAHPEVASRYHVLAEAAGSAATPQIRNVATLAGNLCQRPWCWYLPSELPVLQARRKPLLLPDRREPVQRHFRRRPELHRPSLGHRPGARGPRRPLPPGRPRRRTGRSGGRVLHAAARRRGVRERARCRPRRVSGAPTPRSSRCRATWRARTCCPQPNEILAGVTVAGRVRSPEHVCQGARSGSVDPRVVSVALALQMDGDRIRGALRCRRTATGFVARGSCWAASPPFRGAS